MNNTENITDCLVETFIDQHNYSDFFSRKCNSFSLEYLERVKFFLSVLHVNVKDSLTRIQHRKPRYLTRQVPVVQKETRAALK